MPDKHEGSDDFVSFYREYARSGIHAATAALLTLFGLLSSLASHWIYVGIGVAIYVIPPAYLYATRDGAETDAVSSEEEPSGRETDSTPPSNDQQMEATSEQSTGWRWNPCDSPTNANLVDVTAAAEGAYAVGAGGVVLSRQDKNWEILIADGAGGDGNDFTAVDATSDGGAVWAVGDSGAVARVDVGDGAHADLSAPNDLTSTWTGVAVAGATDEETVYLANGSGVVLRGVMVDGDVRWGQAHKPGSGSSIADLDFPAPQQGVFCDTAGDVFETFDGDAFERIGVDAPHGTLTAVRAGGVIHGDDADATSHKNSSSLEVVVAADDGSVHRRDRHGWTSIRPTDLALFGLAMEKDDYLAVGDGGTVLVDTDDEWEAEAVPVDASLHGTALLANGTAVAVGDRGTLVERRLSATAEE